MGGRTSVIRPGSVGADWHAAGDLSLQQLVEFRRVNSFALGACELCQRWFPLFFGGNPEVNPARAWLADNNTGKCDPGIVVVHMKCHSSEAGGIGSGFDSNRDPADRLPGWRRDLAG